MVTLGYFLVIVGCCFRFSWLRLVTVGDFHGHGWRFSWSLLVIFMVTVGDFHGHGWLLSCYVWSLLVILVVRLVNFGYFYGYVWLCSVKVYAVLGCFLGGVGRCRVHGQY